MKVNEVHTGGDEWVYDFNAEYYKNNRYIAFELLQKNVLNVADFGAVMRNKDDICLRPEGRGVGCTDSKVVDVHLMSRMQCYAINGPSSM